MIIYHRKIPRECLEVFIVAEDVVEGGKYTLESLTTGKYSDP